MQAEIIAVGSELLTPFRLDTNSLFLTGKLNQLGIEVAFKTVVGDALEPLVSVARTAVLRSDIILFIGGLGPTEDDLTREAVAEALGIELRRNPDIVAKLYARFAERRMRMPANNERQADVLGNAILLDNSRGSAPGQWLQTRYSGKEKIVILLPGPPHELQPMYELECRDRLRTIVPPSSIATRVLKVAMMPESECDARIAPIYKQHKHVHATLLATSPGEVQIHLLAKASSMEAAQKLVASLADEIEDELEEWIFSTAGESLEQIVGYYLEMRGATLAVAESCTGGLLSQRLTSVPGSSRYFLGGAVVYDNRLKRSFADVPADLIKRHGAVSKQVAIALAQGIKRRCKASLGAAITCIAGPGGGSEDKPVGLTYMAVTSENSAKVTERRFPGDRERIRSGATQQTLDMIRRQLI